MRASLARLGWPLRSVIAGAAGTTAMTLAYAAEHHVRVNVKGQLDYDDGLVPGEIVASIMHLPQATNSECHELGLALRWSYGSAFGMLHGALRRFVVGEPLASVAFGGVLMTATFSLFPLLGRTPPPWRWPPDVLATSIGTHFAYVATVAAVDDGLRRAARGLSTQASGLTPPILEAFAIALVTMAMVALAAELPALQNGLLTAPMSGRQWFAPGRAT